MPFFPREEKDIIADSIQRLVQSTNINQMSPGGKARFFLSTVAKEHAQLNQQFNDNLLVPYIRYSPGKYLDLFGDMLGLPRYEATHAVSDRTNFMFYVNSGKFGDINGGSGFSIPSGTIVSTIQFAGDIITPGLEEQPSVSYATIESIYCDPNSAYAYVTVKASIEGDESSVPRNTLRQHNFSGYTESAKNTLLCTNRFAIDNGSNRETDDSYRYRLANIFKAKNQATEASIRLAALSVPGVSDVYPVNAEQGPGSFGLYIESTTSTVSSALVSSVADTVQRVTSFGIRPFVSAPISLGVEFVAAVHWSSRATQSDKSIGYGAMRTAAEVYLNSLRRADPLIMANLVDAMLNAAPKVDSIGRSRPKTFEEIYVYKYVSANELPARTLFSGDVLESLYNQRIILETANKYQGIQFVAF